MVPVEVVWEGEAGKDVMEMARLESGDGREGTEVARLSTLIRDERARV